MHEFQPKDIVAIIVVLGIVVLKFTGAGDGLDTFGALILGYYFAKRANGEDRGI